MKILNPSLPYDNAETTLSWVARLAAFHTGGDLMSFLHDIGIPYGDMLANRKHAIARLCDLTGEDHDLVSSNAISQVSQRRYTFGGHTFASEFLHGTNMMFCPACLALDDEGGPNPAIQRRGLTIWTIRAVRTCPKHDLPLINRREAVWSDCLREMAIRVPERGPALAGLAAGLTPRKPSPLQNYCLDRLRGMAGPAWMDGQGIESAFRATSLLGVVLAFGPKRKLNQLTEDEWDTAGRTGFQYSSRDENGIREALSILQARLSVGKQLSRSRSGLPMIFGQLYLWLSAPKNGKDSGPIRQLVREHILDTMEVHPDRVLLGEKVGVRRRHSVHSLATTTATHPTTIRNFLVTSGLIPKHAQKAVDATFDASEGERLVAMMKASVAQIHLPKVLNTTRGQVVQLIEGGILKKISSEKDGQGRQQTAVALDEVQRFLTALSHDAQKVETAPAGTFGIPETAQIAHVPTTTIVQLLLDGDLTLVYQLANVPGYGGIRLYPDEVKALAKPRDPGGVVRLKRVPDRLKLSHATVKALIADKEGGPILQTVSLEGLPVVLVEVQMLDAFARNYVGFMSLSRKLSLNSYQLKRKLEVAGVQPIDDPVRLRERIYRREDVKNL